MELKPLKNRTAKLASKRKVVNMILLFEKYINEEIVSINLSSSEITTYYSTYRVSLAKNTVHKCYPDIE